MCIKILFGDTSSSLSIQLASLVLVTGHNDLMLGISEEFRSEIEGLLKWLESLPENLGKVLAWEALTK